MVRTEKKLKNLPILHHCKSRLIGQTHQIMIDALDELAKQDAKVGEGYSETLPFKLPKWDGVDKIQILSFLIHITKSTLTHEMMHIVIKLENLKGLRGSQSY